MKNGWSNCQQDGAHAKIDHISTTSREHIIKIICSLHVPVLQEIYIANFIFCYWERILTSATNENLNENHFVHNHIRTNGERGRLAWRNVYWIFLHGYISSWERILISVIKENLNEVNSFITTQNHERGCSHEFWIDATH